MHRRLLTLTLVARLPLVLTVLSGFLTGLLTIWQAWLLSNSINTVFLEKGSLEQVSPLLLLMLVPIGGRAWLTWLSEVSANAVAVKIKNDLRERLFAHILRLGPAYSRRQRTGELTNSAVEGIETLDAYFSKYLPQLFITVLVPISILFFAFPIDLLTGLVFIITAPLIPLFMVLIGKGAEAVTKRQYDTLRTLGAHFLDSLQGLTTLKIFGRSKTQAGNIASASKEYRETTLSVLRITFLSAFALELLATLSTAIIAVEIGFRLLYGQMAFQPALFLLVLAPEFYMPLRALGARFHAGMAGTTAASRIYEILDTPIPVNALPGPALQARNGELVAIEFDSVSFTYPNETGSALMDTSLTIRKGQRIALVGKTGAGKSTFVNLMLGFLQPTSGKIFTRRASAATERNLAILQGPPSLLEIAWAPQHPHLFHDTISANIRLGKADATNEQIIEAAQAAHLHSFIDSLPQKYETIIGEGGARLSSGQAQRLALARAFLKDADLLILDEPTSSLDPETEALLEESTMQLMQGKTIITIAHRLNTVYHADQIVVFENGRITEQGTHSELMAKGGAYAAMVKVSKASPGRTDAAGIGETGRRVESRTLKVMHKHETFKSSVIATSNLQPSTQRHQATGSNKQSTILARLLSFLHGSWNRVTLSIFLGTLTVGANISLIGTSAWLISTAALQPSVAELGVAVVGVRFFGLSRAFFRYLERLVSHDVTFRLLSRLRTWFYDKLEPLAPARLMDYHAGDLLARIIGDVEALENFYVRVVSPPLVALMTGVATAIFLAAFYPPLAAVLIGIFLGLGLFLPLSAFLMGRKPGKILVTRRADLNNLLVDGIQGLADLQAFSRASDRATKIASIGQDYGHAQRQMAFISGFHNGLASLLTNLGLWLVAYLTIPQVTNGKIGGPMLASLALITLASFEAVTPLPPAAQMWESLQVAARRLFEIIDAEPMVTEADSRSRGEKRESIKVARPASVTFTNLSFSYPNQAMTAVENISFKVEPGKSLAIVGPSGAGKSTLVNLLLRFWEYNSGDIRLGEKSLHRLEQDWVRAQYAVVPQQSYFFNTSVRENLRVARPAATQIEIETATRQAEIHDLILELPKGYDTLIGEQGQRLSGGERQRLAIARALLKDAPILILDEPTANLDPVTEKQIMDTLIHVMKARTSLLITHRLIGLENMDEILVMEGGRILERGRLADLLSRDGLFRLLWDLQNRILDPGEYSSLQTKECMR